MATVLTNAESLGGVALNPARVSQRDRQLEKAARATLDASGYYYLRVLDCESHEGMLLVHGKLPTYYLKQVAGNLLARLPGVERVIDQTQIVEPHECVEHAHAVERRRVQTG